MMEALATENLPRRLRQVPEIRGTVRKQTVKAFYSGN